MEHEIIKHDKNYPPASSAGGDNAYYLKGCEIVGRVPSYASCLFKISEVEAGRPLVLSPECTPQIKAGKCAACGMREQEKLAGAALYYFPRNKAPFTLPVATTGEFGVPVTNMTPKHLLQEAAKGVSRFIGIASKPAVKKQSTIIGAIDTGTYADAINAGASVTSEKKPQYTKDDLVRLAQPGESLIDTAKRLLNKAKGQE